MADSVQVTSIIDPSETIQNGYSVYNCVLTYDNIASDLPELNTALFHIELQSATARQYNETNDLVTTVLNLEAF